MTEGVHLILTALDLKKGCNPHKRPDMSDFVPLMWDKIPWVQLATRIEYVSPATKRYPNGRVFILKDRYTYNKPIVEERNKK